jgi:hypothetical protein
MMNTNDDTHEDVHAQPSTELYNRLGRACTSSDTCDCDTEDCDHDCCAITRDTVRRRKASVMKSARDMLPVGTPSRRALNATLRDVYGMATPTGEACIAQTLNGQFEDAAPPSTDSMLSGYIRDASMAVERENELKRLTEALPTLESSHAIPEIMSFLYRANCEATMEDDGVLRIKATTIKCKVARIKTVLLAADRTMAGWKKACITIMGAINKQYMSLAKSSLMLSMRQAAKEDPCQYADRVETDLNAYAYFAELSKKSVDPFEFARAWVAGLTPGIKTHVSTAMSSLDSYSIQTALLVARGAHDSLNEGSGASTGAVRLQALAPPAPALDGPYVDQRCQDNFFDYRAGIHSHIEERLAALIPAGPQGASRYPCAHNACNGAYHRFADCPYKATCVHCKKDGHHSCACFTKFPDKDFRSSRDGPRYGNGPGRYANNGREYGNANNRTPNRDHGRTPYNREDDKDRNRGRQDGSDSTSGGKHHGSQKKGDGAAKPAQK